MTVTENIQQEHSAPEEYTQTENASTYEGSPEHYSVVSAPAENVEAKWKSVGYGISKGFSLVNVNDMPYLSASLVCPIISYKDRAPTEKTMIVRVDAPVALAVNNYETIIGGRFAWLANTKEDTIMIAYGKLHFDPMRIVVTGISKAQATKPAVSYLRMPPATIIGVKSDQAILEIANTAERCRVVLPEDAVVTNGIVISANLRSPRDGRFKAPYRLNQIDIVSLATHA